MEATPARSRTIRWCEQPPLHPLLCHGAERVSAKILIGKGRDRAGGHWNRKIIHMIASGHDKQDSVFPRQPIQQARPRRHVSVEELPRIAKTQVDDLNSGRDRCHAPVGIKYSSNGAVNQIHRQLIRRECLIASAIEVRAPWVH